MASVFLSAFEEVRIGKKERYTRNYDYFVFIIYFSAMNALGGQVQIWLNLLSVGLQANSLACISSFRAVLHGDKRSDRTGPKSHSIWTATEPSPNKHIKIALECCLFYVMYILY